ncbi:MAG: 50S ribosomal protein L4 [Caldilineaceae bacterium]|nr:50S ribosomal protein L4 [Caldilineaceae bacterium]
MLLPVKNMAGKQVGELDVSDAVFAAPVNSTLMHQALIRQLSNQRTGTHNTKTRGEVRGGGRKPWRQKGTGRARQGSTTAPNWVGGGTVFGPRPRAYTKSMPRKMRRAALRSALSVKAAGGQLVVIDDLALDAPKTKAMAQALSALGAGEQSALIVMAESNVNVQKSANNLPKVKTLSSSYLNIRDLLGFDMVLLSRDAVAHVEEWLAVEAAETAPADAVADAPAETEE